MSCRHASWTTCTHLHPYLRMRHPSMQLRAADKAFDAMLAVTKVRRSSPRTACGPSLPETTSAPTQTCVAARAGRRWSRCHSRRRRSS